MEGTAQYWVVIFCFVADDMAGTLTIFCWVQLVCIIFFFQDFFDNYVGDDQACVINRLSELILLREGYCGFSYDGVFLSKKELQTLINYTASA